MKKITALFLTIALALLSGCSSPAARHDVRVDRRYDHAENTAGRVEARHDNRYDRRDDRHHRVETRYGY